MVGGKKRHPKRELQYDVYLLSVDMQPETVTIEAHGIIMRGKQDLWEIDGG